MSLALYDVSEVVLKPVFGALSDRIGTKPVIACGLMAFIAASLLALIEPSPLILGLAGLGQGASASAFSPASSATVARSRCRDLGHHLLPTLPVGPRPRYTIAALVRKSTERGCLIPTASGRDHLRLTWLHGSHDGDGRAVRASSDMQLLSQLGGRSTDRGRRLGTGSA